MLHLSVYWSSFFSVKEFIFYWMKLTWKMWTWEEINECEFKRECKLEEEAKRQASKVNVKGRPQGWERVRLHFSFVPTFQRRMWNIDTVQCNGT